MKGNPHSSGYTIFIDFDNTITPFDTLDDIIKRYSINQDWIKTERLWKNGEIGSRECLIRQLSAVRISKNRLNNYLSKIKISGQFFKFLRLLKEKKIHPIILSDNFSYIIKRVLLTNKINGIKLYANRILLKGNRLKPYFPHRDKKCLICGHCKKKNLLKNKTQDKISIYIGDGLSDTCPAQYADLIFAKGSLARHLEKKRVSYKRFKDFSTIYKYLKEEK
jgi:2,3-diketo-5-methylthio-1-phosphopentane phosphatase